MLVDSRRRCLLRRWSGNRAALRPVGYRAVWAKGKAYVSLFAKGGCKLRIVIAALAAVLLSFVLLQNSGGSRGAVPGGQASVNVAVVPGFVSPTYPGYYGIPKLPVTDPQLSQFHFTAVPAAKVTTTRLKQFDTVILYGMRWSSLSVTAQQAIDTFAATGKVVIWDSDDTGSQSYSTFIHPFADSASGENGKANNSVVSFPGGGNFLASSNPNSPYFLHPKPLVRRPNMINGKQGTNTA